MAGITDKGFETPSFTDIQADLFDKAREDFGPDVDLSAASPVRHFIDSWSLTLSDKGLSNEEIDAVWPAIAENFWNAYPSTSTATALDYAAGFRGLTRQGAKKAQGEVTFYDSTSGTSIPSGTTISTANNTEFVTTRDATVRDDGKVDVPAEAVETGGGGNIAPGSITTVVDSVSAKVRNEDDSKTQPIGHIKSVWETIANDGNLNNYQVIPVSFLEHPIGVNDLTFHVRNPSSNGQFFSVHAAIMDHATGDIVKQTEILDLDMSGNEERKITFTGHDHDVAELSDIRIAFANLDLSDGDIEIAVDETEGFAQGQLYLNGVAQTVKDFTMTVASQVEGSFSGGQARETDVDLRKRYFDGLSMGGSARLAAIRSELQRVEGVKSVHLEENETDVDKSGSGGLPPHSVQATVYGGTVDDIADKLLKSRSAGVRLIGGRTATLTDTDGQIHTMRFDRPTQKDIYVDIKDLTTDSQQFPNDGKDQIKDKVIEVIGGVDSEGVFHGGFGVGEDAYHLAVAHAVKSVDGVKGGEVLLGTSQPAQTEDDISIGAKEVAVGKLGNIRFL